MPPAGWVSWYAQGRSGRSPVSSGLAASAFDLDPKAGAVLVTASRYRHDAGACLRPARVPGRPEQRALLAALVLRHEGSDTVCDIPGWKRYHLRIAVHGHSRAPCPLTTLDVTESDLIGVRRVP
jgi:hypothetical protein